MNPVLTHIALHVGEFDAALDFYAEYCGLQCIHRREDASSGSRVAWMAEPGREDELVLVFISGGPSRRADGPDYGHLGFALDSREAVDAVAERGRAAGCLEWPPSDEPHPVGYYCGLRDPDGNVVEFSYGQPLGPGAESLD